MVRNWRAPGIFLFIPSLKRVKSMVRLVTKTSLYPLTSVLYINICRADPGGPIRPCPTKAKKSQPLFPPPKPYFKINQLRNLSPCKKFYAFCLFRMYFFRGGRNSPQEKEWLKSTAFSGDFFARRHGLMSNVKSVLSKEKHILHGPTPRYSGLPSGRPGPCHDSPPWAFSGTAPVGVSEICLFKRFWITFEKLI